MQINAISNLNANTSTYSSYDAGTAIADNSSKEDPRIAGVKQQIRNKEQSIKNIENDENLTSKEKAEKKKKIQDEITQLQQQLVELQKLIEKEEQEKKAEKEQSDGEIEEFQKTEKQKEIESSIIPKDLMEAMVTGQAALLRSASLNWIKTKMEGEARVASSDAKRNASLGVDSSYVAGVAADNNLSIDKVTGMQLKTLREASEKIERSTEEQFIRRQKKAAEERIHDEREADQKNASVETVEQSNGTASEENAQESNLLLSWEDSQSYLDHVVYREIDVLL